MTNHPHRGRVKDWPSYIRRFREKHSLTQQKLADDLDVSLRTIQHWEADENDLRTPPHYLKLALAFIATKLKREREAMHAKPTGEK